MDKYELLEAIGVGGMATVHRARMRGIAGFERIVAIKQIRPELATHPEYVARFVREARIVSALSHANVVQVYELGKLAGAHFIAMEHLEGWSLLRVAAAAQQRDIAMPLHVIVSLLRDLCDALDHVHARCDREGRLLAILHRDISHGNLFVTSSGHLKLIDFGIATADGIGDGIDDSGELAGKPSFMAPEAIRGLPCDGRVDVFAVGVVAWELLACQKLFAGTEDRAVMRSVLHQTVAPPSMYRPDCPVMLDAIVRDALARDLRARTPSAAAMRDQLEALAATYDLDAHPSAVARWIDAVGLFGETEVDLEPFPTTMIPPPPAAPARTAPRLASSIVLIRPAPRRFPSFRVGLAAAALGLISFGVASRAALPAPSPVADPALITMTPIEPVPPPAVEIEVHIPIPRAAKQDVAKPRSHTVVARRAPAAVTTTTPPPRVPTATIQPSSPPRAALTIAPPPAVVIEHAIPSPPAAPLMLTPDRVQLVSGAIRHVDLGHLGHTRHDFTAVLCIDDHGAVTSSKLPRDLPSWLRDQVAQDLARFRFTPVGAPACFARFLQIAK